MTKKRIETQRIVSGPGSSSWVYVDAHVDSTDHGSGSSSGNAGNHGNAVGGGNAVDVANRVSKIEVDCGDVDVKGHRHSSGSGFSIYSRKVDDDSGNAVFRYQDKKTPDINPQTKTPWTKTPLAKNPPDKTYEHKIYFT